MKLICHITLLYWFIISSNCQKFSQEQYPFPPQFKHPNSGVFGSDSSIYLPPESHTTIPYFSINNGNKLPYQFLPPTATKIPSVYPTPFPIVMSSTIMSRRKEEEDDEDEEVSKIRTQHVPPPNLQIKNNQTFKNNEHTEDREMRPIPKTFNNQYPIDRIDHKYPQQFHTVTPKTNQISQTPSSQRRMIISSEILKNDQYSDQVKRASILSPQLISSPITYYSTTEPAIPILRLSNEMDLDGSFSYEALGADQTHYVQHSRMENSGTDKEEQVVEGSYSYVGDNGQTYTVHYVADSNGYRASGDHLPVPPPVPEIIQRAVQYNLAEEAKKSSTLKSWQDNDKDFERNENDKQRFSISPPRNLFTGRTPEAFSFGLSQSSILQNNVAAADNSHAPIKTNFDFSADQAKGKINNGPIAPQITFLASQGAHNPQNSGQQQNSRIFPTDKPTLPQIMNYEAASSESDQDSNKGLWRWQYGLNANTGNENPNKNSISRSFGEGDDVIINFNNMTPEQYTNLIKNDFLEPNTEVPSDQKEFNKQNVYKETENYVKYVESHNIHTNKNENTNARDDKQNNGIDNTSVFKEQPISLSTENIVPFSFSTISSKETEVEQYSKDHEELNAKYDLHKTSKPLDIESYGYSNTPYESTKLSSYITTVPSKLFNDNGYKDNEDTIIINDFKNDTHKFYSDTRVSLSDDIPKPVNNIKFTDFIQREEKSNFKPSVKISFEKQSTQETTTAESSPENILRENYFLRNIFKSENTSPNSVSEKIDGSQQSLSNKVITESNNEKLPKYMHYHSKPQNEINNIVNKPLDIADVLNYITLKNHFESNKLKSKNKYPSPDKYIQRIEKPQVFIPLENDRNEREEQLEQEETHNNLRPLNNQKQQGLRGIIKNYKVLQRNSSTKNVGQNKDQFMTDASQRHLKTIQSQNLPPLGRAGPSMKSYLPPTYI